MSNSEKYAADTAEKITALNLKTGPATGISKFEVKFDASSAIQSKSLYGNGRMQVRVLVLISGEDKDGNVVPLPASVLNTVFPIYYNGGHSLSGNWAVWNVENDYLHELPPAAQYRRSAPLSEQREDNVALQNPHVLEFWISSSVVGSTQVGAIVEINGKTIRTNNTGNPDADKFDSSVTLNALAPVIYPVDYFHLQTVKVEGAPSLSPMNKVYVSLSALGKSVKLRRWRERNGIAGIPGSEIFRDIRESEGWTFLYALVHEDIKVYPVSLMNGGGTFNVTVNERVGELTIVSVLNYKTGVGYTKLGVFYFSAFDEYGTEHRLSLRPAFYTNGNIQDIFLDRG